MGQPRSDRVREEARDGGNVEQGARARRDAGIPAGPDIPPKSGRNYRFGPDDLTYEGSWLKKAEQNVAAVELLKTLEKEGRQATPDEQKILAKFIGWRASEIANAIFGDKLTKKADAIAAYRAAREARGAGLSIIDQFHHAYWTIFRAIYHKVSVPYGELGARCQQCEVCGAACAGIDRSRAVVSLPATAWRHGRYRVRVVTSFFDRLRNNGRMTSSASLSRKGNYRFTLM